MDIEGSVIVADLDDLIKKLHEVFDAEIVNIEQVKALLEAYKSNPKDWKRFAKFDRHRSGWNIIHDNKIL